MDGSQSIIKEPRAGAQDRNLEVDMESEVRGHRGVLLTGLLLMACPACFLMHP